MSFHIKEEQETEFIVITSPNISSQSDPIGDSFIKTEPDEDSNLLYPQINENPSQNLPSIPRISYTACRGDKQLNFTAQEVNDRIILEGNPPIARLLPKHHTPVAGKVPYTRLLCEKLSQITPNKSSFKVVAAFVTDQGKSRCYVVCDHNVKMPVWFMQADLQENHGLALWTKLKCNDCNEPTSDVLMAATQSTQLEPPRTFVLPSVSAPNEITALFERATVELGKVLTRAYHSCSATADPLRALQDRQYQVGEELAQTWRSVVKDAFRNDVGNDVGNTGEDLNQDELEAEQRKSLAKQNQHAEINGSAFVNNRWMSRRARLAVEEQKANLNKRWRRK